MPDGTDDTLYLEALEAGISRSLKDAQADLAIYIAGADPYIGDRLGRLSLSLRGLAQRDQLVLEHCRKQKLPVAIVMGGGYAKRVEETIAIHHQTIRIAAAMCETYFGDLRR